MVGGHDIENPPPPSFLPRWAEPPPLINSLQMIHLLNFQRPMYVDRKRGRQNQPQIYPSVTGNGGDFFPETDQLMYTRQLAEAMARDEEEEGQDDGAQSPLIMSPPAAAAYFAP